MQDLFSVDLTLLGWAIFAVAGIVTGIINTLAGSGSLITLPIFVFLCGLPAPVANGTNRIGVIFQCAVGLSAYKKTGITTFDSASWLVAPAVVGGVLGSFIAVDLNEEMMNLTLGLLMVIMMIVLLIKPGRWIHEMPLALHRNKHPLTVSVFFLIGVYGGFIQAGVGIFLLAGLVLISRYSLSSGNVIKLLIVLVYTIASLSVFFWFDQVHLGYGMAMAVFQALGAWVAVKWVVRYKRADIWIHRLLIVIVAAAAIKFLF